MRGKAETGAPPKYLPKGFVLDENGKISFESVYVMEAHVLINYTKSLFSRRCVGTINVKVDFSNMKGHRETAKNPYFKTLIIGFFELLEEEAYLYRVRMLKELWNGNVPAWAQEISDSDDDDATMGEFPSDDGGDDGNVDEDDDTSMRKTWDVVKPFFHLLPARNGLMLFSRVCLSETKKGEDNEHEETQESRDKDKKYHDLRARTKHGFFEGRRVVRI